jgi:murein DD-endopeptidase MepM/ murein hydrolase activator NlpD
MVRAFAIFVGLTFAALGATSAHAKGLRHVQYTVREGDTLHALARRYGCTVHDLQRKNEIGKILPIGKKLRIPACGKDRGELRLAARAEDPRARRSSEPRIAPGASRQRNAPPTRPTRRAAEVSTGGIRPLGELRRPLEPDRAPSTPDDQPVTRPTTGPVTEPVTDPVAEPVTDPDAEPTMTGSSIAQDARLVPGSRTRVEPDIAPAPGQSVGQPWNGRLQDAARLGYGEGYVLRRPGRTYGTATTIAHVEHALAELRQKFPRLHPIAVGDLSLPTGGPVSDHRSHQSGRDIDLGLCFHHRPRGYPRSFVAASEDTLHAAAMWAMISAFAETAHFDGGVEMMFLDFEVQGMVYRWAAAEGVDRGRLDAIFQFPHGRGGAGLVRHEPNHGDHLHVRFRCGRSEVNCQ